MARPKAILPKEEAKQRPLETYGCQLTDKSQLFYDRWAFAYKIPITQGAPMRNKLFWRVADTLCPDYFEKHDWTHRMVDAMCFNQWVGVAGCAGSAKTHNIVGWACLWWMAAPEISNVILCSTTSKALRKRGWANVQAFYSSIPGTRFGNFVDSRMMWQGERGDDKHSIVGIAVEEGETNKVADNIKGTHTTRQLVIIDEATAVPEAIFEACTNLYSYPREFLLVMIGNPRSRLDQFGKFCEPAKGWNSVTVDDYEWETKPQLNGVNGICVRFDAENSPNIVSPLPDGKLVSRHLPTKERVEQRRRHPGFENDPSYWSNERGFWAPEGISKCVFSEVALTASDAYGRHQFTGNNFRIVGALDPARTGGDRPTLRFAAIGEIKGGDWGIELMPPILIPLDARSSNPIDYQLVEQVRRECENVNYRGLRMHCKPEDFGIDATGGGADLCDIAQRIWSPNIIRIGFGESPSDDPISHEDIRKASEVYRNVRCEMYFRARHCLDTQQLKGMDSETAKELCSLEYDDSKALMVMINKKDYHKKFGKSPDLSDCAVMCAHVARKRGFKLAIRGHTATVGERFEEHVANANDVYASASYSAEEPEGELALDDWG